MSGCNCPICMAGGALETASRALNAMIESEANLECDHYYLRDEVRAVLSSPWWQGGARKRLKQALATISSPARSSGGPPSAP